MKLLLPWKCIALLTLAFANAGVLGSLPVVFPVETWPLCYIAAKIQGTCERLVHCPQAVQAVYRGLHPPACYWERHQTFPLVCCPVHDSLNDILEPERNAHTPVQGNGNEPECGRLDGELITSDDSSASLNHVWPWMVSIYKDGEQPIPVGSGFLIDDKHVLSAAQNFPAPPHTSGWSVRLERPRRDLSGVVEPAPVYTVKEIKLHEGFRSWVRYDDLALVTLDEPVRDAKPVCLPPSNFDTNTIAGINATVLGGHREEQVPVVSSQWCSEVYAKFLPLSYPRGLDGEFFCAGLQLNEQPDSHVPEHQGGPVMAQTKDGSWMAVGLVSLDYKNTEQGLPGVYLNLAHYRDWIDERRAASN